MKVKHKILLTVIIAFLAITSTVLLCLYYIKQSNKKFINLIHSDLIEKNRDELFGIMPQNACIIMLSKVTLASTDVLVISPNESTLTSQYILPFVDYNEEKLAAYSSIKNAFSLLSMKFKEYRRYIPLEKKNISVLDKENLFARIGARLFWNYDIVRFEKFLSFFATTFSTNDLFCYLFKISNGKLSIIRLEIVGVKAVKKNCTEYYLGKYAQNMMAYFVEMQAERMTDKDLQTVLHA